MNRTDFGRRLLDIRAEVTVLFAKERIARIELDMALKEVLEAIDLTIQESVATAPIAADSDEYLKRCAVEIECNVHQINTTQGRYFGTVMAEDAFGIMINHKTRSVIIVPRIDMVGLERIPKTNDSVLIQYFHGKCQVAFRK